MVLAVVLENNIWTYYPGQTITGHVVVTKNIWHKVEGLSIRFLGRMEFGSEATAPPLPPPLDTLPQSYQQERSLLERFTRRPVQDMFLDQKTNLIHSWKVLKPGSHEFPFSFTLPEEDLPESIKIDGCRVMYEFVVVLRRPRDDFKVYQTPFYVHTRFEEAAGSVAAAITMPKYSTIFEMKMEDTIGFCICCTSGPYGILFKVPRRIAMIGQDVDFVLEIWNETSVTLDSAKVRLVREFKHKKGLQGKNKQVVSELAGIPIQSGKHEVWASYFRIPGNTPPTSFVRRETFEINYFLKALIHPLNRTNKSISVKCPLLVIRGGEPQPNVANFLTGHGIDTVIVGVPPPTYEEAMALDNTSASPLLD